MYLIDGHNLIPKIPGLSLQAIDDETRLIELVRVWARIRERREVEIFFDGAPPGYSGDRAYGTLKTHFALLGQTADEAIRRRLNGLGKAARNATVVTSDRQVRTNAKALHANVISSESFAKDLVSAWQVDEAYRAARAEQKSEQKSRHEAERRAAQEPVPPPVETPKKPRHGQRPEGVTRDELGDWLDLFGIDPQQASKPIEPPDSPSRPRRKPRSSPGYPSKGRR